jgi:chaperonin cofactor prefoldin
MDQFETRMDRLDARMDQFDARMDRLDARMDQFDARMDRLETRMDRLEAHMMRFDDKLDGFHQALRDQTRTYMFTMTGVMASFAAIVVATGILT